MSSALIKSSSLKDLVQNETVKNRLKEVIGERAPQFAAALVQIVNQSFQLQKCDPSSVIGAAFTAAALDLSIDPNIGEAHLIPYGDKCQFQIGFKGFIQLAMRSGKYKSFGSTVVYEGELESYDELDGLLKLAKSKKTSDKVIGYAARFRLLNGFERGEYWTAEEIESHAMMYSKQYKFSKGKPDKEANCLWITKRDEMAIKTVEKSLLNHYGPKSIQMEKAIKMDGGAVIDADTGDVSYVDNGREPVAAEPEFKEPKKLVEREPATVVPTDENVAVKKNITPKKEESKPESGLNKLKAVKGLIQLASLTEDEVVAFVADLGVSNEKALDKMDSSVVDMLYEQGADIFNRIKNQKGVSQ